MGKVGTNVTTCFSLLPGPCVEWRGPELNCSQFHKFRQPLAKGRAFVRHVRFCLARGANTLGSASLPKSDFATRPGQSLRVLSTPSTTAFHMKLEDFRNRHLGERAFIIGNGSSLSGTPLHLLNDEITFATNKISYIYDETTWRPTYYGYSRRSEPTRERLERYKDSLELGIPAFITSDNIQYFDDKCNIFELEKKNLNMSYEDQVSVREKIIQSGDIKSLWSEDITDGVYRTSTSLYPLAQIASYMGFDRIYFVGCDMYKPMKPHIIFNDGNDPDDFDFTQSSKFHNLVDYMTDSDNNIKSFGNLLYWKLLDYNITKRFVMKYGGVEMNYFSKEYQLPRVGKAYTEARNERLSQGHRLIEMAGERYGFDVFNATVGGRLEEHERVPILSLVP